MNAKAEPTYIHEEVPNQPWIKSKAGKLTSIIVGGVIVLGGAFGAGLVVGAEAGHSIPGIGGFDRDGDHKLPGGDGQRPPRPGDDDGGPQGFGGDGKFTPIDPNQSSAPAQP